MKKSFKFNRIKTKSLDNYRISKMKNIFKKRRNNQSMKNIYISLLNNKGSINKLENDKITILSNANLDIIKMIDSCLNKELSELSSTMKINNDRLSTFLPEYQTKQKSIDNKELDSNKYKSVFDMSQINTIKKRKNNLNLNSEINVNKKIKTLSSNKNIHINHFSKNNLITHKQITEKEKIQKNNKKISEKEKYFSNIDRINRKSKYFSKNEIKSRKRSKSILFNENNLLQKKDSIINAAFIFNDLNQSLSDIKCEKNENLLNYLNEIEIMKINNIIHHDINFIQLKNKISQLKKSIKSKYSNNQLVKKKYNENFSNYKSINENNMNNEEQSDKFLLKNSK